VIARGPGRTRGRPATRPRVGLFGGLGTGNIGNDASLEAVLGYLRTAHPEALLDVMCGGPQVVRDRYGLAASPAQWHQGHGKRASGAVAIALKVLGKGIDAFRTASWVRRHDVVIVPGMGVLEPGILMRPWQFPYDIFVLCASGRIFGTKVALVSVGADVIDQRLTRWLLVSAASLAFYRSYRDTLSRDALRSQGLDTTRDHVYSDVAFGLPTPSRGPGDPQTVGIGVMDCYGSSADDPSRADEIRACYVEKMKLFVRWLVDSGRKVRLFIGDANGSDDTVVQEILVDLRAYRPDLDSAWVVSEPVSTFAELMRAMEPAGVVVATRYHNVICSLMLAKPTISIGYAAKNTVLMADMGLAEYCQLVSSLDVDQLIEQFTDVEKRAALLRATIAQHSDANQRLIERQFAELSAALFRSAAADGESRLPRRGSD
jgi:polysaccharide pyruvyl transferase WcaK-like protein